MFTGIVETTGEVLQRQGRRLVIRPARPLPGMRAGESVAVDGVCLTAESISNGRLTFCLLPETVRVTTLGALKKGSVVNLERSLRLGSRLGGHLVWGHVDGRGTVERRLRQAGAVTLEIRAPSEMGDFLVPKGPIAVDGVSLTVDLPKRESAQFQVHLVAHTLAVTTLGRKDRGDAVNLEMDPVAKYLWRMLY